MTLEGLQSQNAEQPRKPDRVEKWLRSVAFSQGILLQVSEESEIYDPRTAVEIVLQEAINFLAANDYVDSAKVETIWSKCSEQLNKSYEDEIYPNRFLLSSTSMPSSININLINAENILYMEFMFVNDDDDLKDLLEQMFTDFLAEKIEESPGIPFLLIPSDVIIEATIPDMKRKETEFGQLMSYLESLGLMIDEKRLTEQARQVVIGELIDRVNAKLIASLNRSQDNEQARETQKQLTSDTLALANQELPHPRFIENLINTCRLILLEKNVQDVNLIDMMAKIDRNEKLGEEDIAAFARNLDERIWEIAMTGYFRNRFANSGIELPEARDSTTVRNFLVRNYLLFSSTVLRKIFTELCRISGEWANSLIARLIELRDPKTNEMSILRDNEAQNNGLLFDNGQLGALRSLTYSVTAESPKNPALNLSMEIPISGIYNFASSRFEITGYGTFANLRILLDRSVVGFGDFFQLRSAIFSEVDRIQKKDDETTEKKWKKTKKQPKK